MIEQPPAGVDSGARPVIATTAWLRGFRISTVRRPDGSSFTVTVPSFGMAEGTEHLAPGLPWITADDRPRQPSDAAVALLAGALSAAGASHHPYH